MIKYGWDSKRYPRWLSSSVWRSNPEIVYVVSRHVEAPTGHTILLRALVQTAIAMVIETERNEHNRLNLTNAPNQLHSGQRAWPAAPAQDAAQKAEQTRNPAAPAPARRKPQASKPCYDWQSGHCSRGDWCQYSHNGWSESRSRMWDVQVLGSTGDLIRLGLRIDDQDRFLR